MKSRSVNNDMDLCLYVGLRCIEEKVYKTLVQLSDIVNNSPGMSQILINENIVSILLTHFHKYVPSLPSEKRAIAKKAIIDFIRTLVDTATDKDKLIAELVPAFKVIVQSESEVKHVQVYAQEFLNTYNPKKKKFSSKSTQKIGKQDAAESNPSLLAK
jgi:hypothetical protein